MNKKIAFSFLLLTLLFTLSQAFFAYAAPADCDPTTEVCLANPLATEKTPNPTIAQFIGTVIDGILGVVGSLALVMFIYGGLTWMTSAGGAEKVKKGKDILIWAVIGLVIIFSAYALVNFVIFDVVQAPTTTG